MILLPALIIATLQSQPLASTQPVRPLIAALAAPVAGGQLPLTIEVGPGGPRVLAATVDGAIHIVRPIAPSRTRRSIAVQVPIPARSVGRHVDVQMFQIGLLGAGPVGGISSPVGPLGAPGPTISSLGSSSGATGGVLAVNGVGFATAPDAVSISIAGSGLGIVTSGTFAFAVAAIEGGAEQASGPITLINGSREFVPASAFGSTPSLPAIPGLSIFTGVARNVSVATSTQSFQLDFNPQLAPFIEQSSAGPGNQYRLQCVDWNPGDQLRFWIKLEYQGRIHDAYFSTSPGGVGSATVTVPSHMTAQWAAIWSAAWLQSSFEGRIAGFTCDVNDGAIIIRASHGSGITGMIGGFVTTGGL